MPTQEKDHRFEDERDLEDSLAELLGDRLDRGFAGFRWSPNMPEDDEYAEMLAVKDDREYEVFISVTLTEKVVPTFHPRNPTPAP